MSGLIIEDTLDRYKHNFQTYARKSGMHPIEFIGNTYLSVLDSLETDYITSDELMECLKHAVESESKTKVFCGTEVYDYLTALEILGGKKGATLNFDFDVILDELKENKPYFKKIKKLAKTITAKEKAITIDMNFGGLQKCEDDTFIYN